MALEPVIPTIPSRRLTLVERSLSSRLRWDCVFTRTTLHLINRAADLHCAAGGAAENFYHILLSRAEYRDYRLTLFTTLRLSGRPPRTMNNLIFPTSNEYQCSLAFRSVLQFRRDTGLNLRL